MGFIVIKNIVEGYEKRDYKSNDYCFLSLKILKELIN